MSVQGEYGKTIERNHVMHDNHDFAVIIRLRSHDRVAVGSGENNLARTGSVDRRIARINKLNTKVDGTSTPLGTAIRICAVRPMD